MVALVILLLVAFSLAPWRERLLAFAISRVATALPGDLLVEDWHWPSPGTIRLHGVRWQDGATTLAAAEELSFSLGLPALAQRDLEIRQLTLRHAWADVPALTARLEKLPRDATTTQGKPRFPRPGALPGVPSLLVHRLQVQADSLRLRPQQLVVGLEVACSIEARHAHTPRIRLEHLRAKSLDAGWAIETLAVDVDLERGSARGHGRGQLQPQWPVFFALEPDGTDRFVLRLSDAERLAPPERPGILATLRVVRRRGAVEAVTWDATLGLPGTAQLARIPALAARLQGKPTLPQLTCAANGRLTLHPRPAFALELQIEPDSLVRAGRLSCAGDAETWQLACEELQLADLRLSGRLRRSSDSLVAAVAIDVQGDRALEALGVAALPSLQVQAQAQARLHRATRTARVSLDATGSVAGQTLDRLQLLGKVSLRAPAQADITLRLAGRGLQAGLAAEIEWGDALRARLGPLVVAARPETLTVPERGAGMLRYAPRHRELELRGFRLRGDAGNADVALQRDAAGNGRFEAQLAWPIAPALLQRFFTPRDPRLDSLRSAWGSDAPYRLDIAGTFAPAGKARLAGSFTLPGPRTLAAFMPAPLRSETLGSLAGNLQLAVEPSAGGRVLRAELDASRTQWIDSLHVRAVSAGASHHVERAECVIAGTRVSLDGTLAAASMELHVRLDMPDSALVQRLLRAGAAPSLRCSGEATLSGPPTQPSIEATLQGRIAAAGYRIPGAHAALRRDSTATRLFIHLPEGVQAAWLHLDSVQAQVTTGPTTFPAALSLRARGPGMELQQAARIVADSLWSVHVQALRLVLGGKDLQARAPFRVSGGSGRVRLEEIDLAGALGRIEAHGQASADSTRLTTRLDLVLPEKPAMLSLPEDLWPRRLQFALDATAASLRAEAELQGFRLAGGGRPALSLDLQAGDELVRASARLADSSVTYLDAEAQAPLRLRLYPPLAHLDAGGVSASARFAALPFALRTGRKSSRREPESLARVGGNLFLRGTTSALAGFAAVRVNLPEPHSPVWLELHARTGEDRRVDSLWSAADIPKDVAPPQAAACTAVFRLADPAGTLLHGSATYPGRLSLEPPSWRDASGRVAAVLRSEALALSHLNPYLRGAALEGVLALTAAVEGAVHNPSLSGEARTADVVLTLSDGSRIVLGGALRLGGEKEHPRLDGEIEVKTGLIKVPELPKNLHPATGEALLLGGVPPPSGSAGPAGQAATDPAGAAAPPGTSAADALPKTSLASAEIDIGVRIPGAFGVRGRGLDLELSGDLRVQQRNGLPSVVGELRVVRGTYSLLGRTFNLDRGVVTFFGDLTMRPRLDIQLSTQVSGTKIRVFLSGTTEKPEITLSSDPEMEQTDIVALLAVGKTFDQVSDEESSLLRDRAAAVLISVGAAALQENVSSQLGIDVVQYRSTGGAATESSSQSSGSLAFGKYLSPRLLLSYSYALDRAAQDLVSVEYFLRGEFRIETLYSAGGQTGLGFGWTREY